MKRAGVLAALVFSGLTALVYQIVWTRLLGFAFGTTTEAISTVLAVFFGGLALGNALAARWLARVERPLRVYAWLEAGIGAYALASLALLRNLDALYLWVGVPESSAGLVALRMLAAAALLLPPTIAMGATLPVVARGWVQQEGAVGRGSAQLYAANTFGAVLGAYLCGFWLIPFLGLSKAVLLSGSVNLGVALGVARLAGDWRVAPDPAEVPVTPAGDPADRRRAIYLACFAVSGFVAIGYEIVWSKVFGVVMEGTLYGFAAVLSAYLLGIGLGSLAISRWVDRIRDLPRAFAWLHLAIGGAVVLGTIVIPYLPHLYARLKAVAPGSDAIHLLYAVVLPIVLVPTLLFGAAFPLLVRMHARSARNTGRSVGLATAVNTAGSIAASLLVGFWWIPSLGMDGSLFALLWIDFVAALALLALFQTGGARVRWPSLAGGAALVGTVSLAYGGIHVEEALAGRRVQADDLAAYRTALAEAGEERSVTFEGRSAIVSVYATELGRMLRTNGLPEAGVKYSQPYAPFGTVALGLWPYLAAERAENALVVGLGGGNTVEALLQTGLRHVDVVELEPGVVRAVELLHQGRPNPLDDPRVALRLGDGRNDLLLRNRRGAPGYDLIASQPSHPWRVGAANLFTEEFFQLARGALRDGGVFASWLNGFRMDADALLAVVGSFERVFPGAVVIDLSREGRTAFLLMGSTRPLRLDPRRMAARLAEPRLADYLTPYPVGGVAGLLARVEGPAAGFAALAPALRNTDDNAYVETRTPRQLDWQMLDFAELERRLPDDAPLLPPLDAPIDAAAVGRALLSREARSATWPYATSLERLLRQHGAALSPWEKDLLRAEGALGDPAREAQALTVLRRLAESFPQRPEPHRALGRHLALVRNDWGPAARAFERAHATSGDAQDAYDAGRALHPIDPEGAWRWFERIPEAAQAEFPRLAFYRAQRALRQQRDAELPALYPALLAWLESPAGRRYPGGRELAGRVAFRLGRDAEARAHAAADLAQREARATPQLDAARAALERGDPAAAVRSLRAAQADLPGDPELELLRAELGLATGDEAQVAHALGALRRYAPSVERANALENDFRSRHGLPLRGAPGADRLGTPHKVR